MIQTEKIMPIILIRKIIVQDFSESMFCFPAPKVHGTPPQRDALGIGGSLRERHFYSSRKHFYSSRSYFYSSREHFCLSESTFYLPEAIFTLPESIFTLPEAITYFPKFAFISPDWKLKSKTHVINVDLYLFNHFKFYYHGN